MIDGVVPTVMESTGRWNAGVDEWKQRLAIWDSYERRMMAGMDAGLVVALGLHILVVPPRSILLQLA